MGALTRGVDHVGLTVADLDASKTFFIDCLGFTLKGGNPDYPSAYVTDGVTTITLWQAGEAPVAFDRHRNIGLHHLAFRLSSEDELHQLHEKVAGWPGIEVEFAPEFSGKGPKVHSMIREPGGNRVEFSWDPR